MADDSLAAFLQRNALDPAEANARDMADKPFWGDTQWRGPTGYDYLPFPAKGSQMADFLLTGLMGLGAMRPRSGVDSLTAARLEHGAKSKGDYGPDIMRADMTNVVANELGGVRPAADPAPYYPARRDRPSPANQNETGWLKYGDNPDAAKYYNELIRQSILRESGPDLTIIPGGRKD